VLTTANTKVVSSIPGIQRLEYIYFLEINLYEFDFYVTLSHWFPLGLYSVRNKVNDLLLERVLVFVIFLHASSSDARLIYANDMNPKIIGVFVVRLLIIWTMCVISMEQSTETYTRFLRKSRDCAWNIQCAVCLHFILHPLQSVCQMSRCCGAVRTIP